MYRINTAALSGTTIGLVGGIALGVNVLIESPLLLRRLYKIHRKKKFAVISSTEAKRQYTVETTTSVNTIAGGVGGAVVGQVAIPVPVLGAVVGGFVGVLAGKGIGYLEGRAVAAVLINDDKETDLPVIKAYSIFLDRLHLDILCCIFLCNIMIFKLNNNYLQLCCYSDIDTWLRLFYSF